MTDDIKECQKKCRSHVYRTPDYRLQRRVLNYSSRGKRYLGRPRMRWFEQFVSPRNRSDGPKPCKEEKNFRGHNFMAIFKGVSPARVSNTWLTLRLLVGKHAKVVASAVHISSAKES
jgi:hypothetical protein